MSISEHSGSKYVRRIYDCVTPGESAQVDVYAVLKAFQVTCPARQHLLAGHRGKGSETQDLEEARDAVLRSIEISCEPEG